MLDSCSPDFGHKVKKKDKSRETTELCSHVLHKSRDGPIERYS